MAAFLIWASLLNVRLPTLPLPDARPQPVAIHPVFVYPVRPHLAR